jgi:hypothetical protein
VFRRRRFFYGKPVRGQNDIAWLTPSGEEMTDSDWTVGYAKSLAVFLNGEAITEPDRRGRPIRDDGKLFGLLMLEGFQAGLSWRTILHRRHHFERAFEGWDARKIAAFRDFMADVIQKEWVECDEARTTRHGTQREHDRRTFADHLAVRQPQGRNLACRIERKIFGASMFTCGHVHRMVQTRFADTVATIAPGVAHQVVFDIRPGAPSRWNLEPPAMLVHRFTPDWGFVSHIVYIGDHGADAPFSDHHPRIRW